MCKAESGRSPAESRLFFAAICALRTAGQTAGVRLPPPRTKEWPVCSSGHRASELRSALGTGSAGPHLSGDARDPVKQPADHFRARRADAGHVRDAAGWHAVSSSRWSLPAATIFFGTDSQRERAAVVHRARFNFMSEARIWYSRDPDQKLPPGPRQNVIVLSHEFYREILNHPIPADLKAQRRYERTCAATATVADAAPLYEEWLRRMIGNTSPTRS